MDSITSDFPELSDQLIPPLKNSGDIIVTYAWPTYNDIQSIPFKVIDEYQWETIESAVLFGVSIGACSLLLLFLVVMSYNNRKKKLFHSFLFNLNATILLAQILRSGLTINVLLSQLSTPSFYVTSIYSGESFAMTDTANAFKVIVIGLIQISLTYQVYVIFKGQRLNIWSVSATVFSGLFSMVVVGFTIYSVVLAHKKSVAFSQGRLVNYVSVWNELPVWLFSANINIMSVLLITKLGMAIRTRRYLGLKQFDGLHILVIMSTQTLIIPSIFLFVHYFGVSGIGSSLVQISILLIVLMLPLTSLWAQTQNNTEHINSSPSMAFFKRETSNDTMVNSQSGTTIKSGLNSEKNTPSTIQGSTLHFANSNNAPASALPPDIEQLLGEEDTVTPTKE